MSGGFFRGTSADQDTRFSNKQAKLLKSQKFAPELEHLVDMTKVKIDVMNPWIAKRVTELIGFEDEVLINFIYGLLEGKAVNGKHVQISLTGFMERNTAKFMKEMWTLLLSAQQNVSGVPQEFLDAKEEETKKKKAETDRIADEIQKKKDMEKKEFEQEKRKMGDISATSKDKHAEMEPSERHGARGLSAQPADENEMYKKNGYRRRTRDSRTPSPDSSYSPQSPRKKHSPSSSSRSHSDDRPRSRNITRAHLSRNRSTSPDRVRRTSPRRSVTPRQRHISRRSPSPWHRSSHSRRRFTPRSQHRSRSPAQYRARYTLRYRSRSPLRRRSRSVRQKSRTPIERSPAFRGSRMPTRHRSPSPYKGWSPSPEKVKHLYPRNRGSPSVLRRRAPSPLRHRSPFRRSLSQSPTIRRYQRSPTRSLSPVQRKSYIREQKGSFIPVLRRSPSSGESSSPTPVRQTSLSPVRRETLKNIRSQVQSTRERIRRHENHSPGSTSSDEAAGRLLNRKGTGSAESRRIVLRKSPERNMSPSGYAYDASGGRLHSEERRSISPHSSPSRSRGRMIQHGSVRPSPKGAGHRSYPDSGESAYGKQSLSGRVPERTDSRETHEQEESEVARKMSGLSQNKYKVYGDDGDRVVDKKNVPTGNRKGSDRELEALPESSRNIEPSDLNGLLDSPSGGIDKNKVHAREYRKQKRFSREEEDSDDFSSDDSLEERKEKKRRKEEKILRKEERHRKREEKSRRKEERRAAKRKIKAADVNSPSSDLVPDISEGESVKKRESRAISTEDAESEQKRLEIELREKALKSLRAKKKGPSS